MSVRKIHGICLSSRCKISSVCDPCRFRDGLTRSRVAEAIESPPDSRGAAAPRTEPRNWFEKESVTTILEQFQRYLYKTAYFSQGCYLIGISHQGRTKIIWKGN